MFPRRPSVNSKFLLTYLKFSTEAYVFLVLGLLFFVIAIHESIHYLVALSFGLRPAIEIGAGQGAVVVTFSSTQFDLLMGGLPLFVEGFLGTTLLLGGIRNGNGAFLGAGSSFLLGIASSISRYPDSDFWYLYEEGLLLPTMILMAVAILLGFTLNLRGKRTVKRRLLRKPRPFPLCNLFASRISVLAREAFALETSPSWDVENRCFNV